MKKIVLLVVSLLLVFGLSACDNVYIEPDVIGMVYEDVKYVGSDVVVTVFITNGTDEDYTMNSVDVALYLPDSEIEVCGGNFELNTVIPSNEYQEWELTFDSEFVFLSLSEVNDQGFDVEDLELYFWLEE